MRGRERVGARRRRGGGEAGRRRRHDRCPRRGRDERVRLIGIDTPETVDPRKPVQCFGKEASDHTKALLPAGTAVRLERDAEARDRYDRLLAYVYRASDGLFVNLELGA